MYKGDPRLSETIPTGRSTYDIVLANINRNVLAHLRGDLKTA
jgi:hypothetical protein